MARQLPHDLEAEKAVLGSVLLDNDVLLTAQRQIDSRAFYSPSNRAVWNAFLAVRQSGLTLDPVTVGGELKRKGVREPAKSITGLTDAVATAANVNHYIEILSRKSQTRDVIRAASTVVESGLDDPPDMAEFLSDARRALVAAFDAVSVGGEPVKLSHGVEAIIEKICSGEPPTEIIPTGFQAVDRIAGGLWSPLLHVVAGRPSMGKSMFLLNLAINLALRGLRVLYYTLEDSQPYQTRRALARLADVSMREVMRQSVPQSQFRKLLEAANLLSTLPVSVQDIPATSAQIVDTAIAMKAREGLDVLLVDHLGYVADKGKEYEVNSAAVRTFAYGAKQLDIPVVLAHQLNREVENRVNKRPILADLRGSGKIEEDARVVWFAYRPFYYEPDDPSLENKWELIIAKAAHGMTGKVDLWCDLSKMYIRDVDAVVGTNKAQSNDY